MVKLIIQEEEKHKTKTKSIIKNTRYRKNKKFSLW
jgi:hypothetical protein